ncbi:EscE/YscE/SsaE family type III secretion system needle protein co-chaperone [Achromobacter sp. Bel]|uniref:EscE/YscE/SsaE family type III secretion system needle protein co-chaperone n=1 Tax=Achromobacter sp. Bel TaxID=2727415 RepID=UPI00145CA0ED|nr:EscE/YscE/SsaE family type III secretion system needle protein co-chaperone [Achromobacter sp. Bel]NMK47583.1 hypothetical protein [Achromobacter sp. Bel]
MNNPADLTELEQRLAAPGGAALRDTLAARLAVLEDDARTRLGRGLPPATFQHCQAIADAAQAARAVLASVPDPTSPAGAFASAPFPPLNR